MAASFYSHTFPPHSHEFYCVGVTESGVAALRCNGRMHHAPPRAITTINPGEVHTGFRSSRTAWRYRAFYADQRLLIGIASQMAGKLVRHVEFTSTILQNDALARRLTSAHRSMEAGTDTLESQSRFVLAISDLLRVQGDLSAFATRRRDPAAALRVREHIEHFAHTRLTLTELGEVARRSPVYTLRLFRRTYGLPPHAYLMQVRIARARKLLARASIVETALSLGFNDQSHFTNAFRQLVGVPPGAYRKLAN